MRDSFAAAAIGISAAAVIALGSALVTAGLDRQTGEPAPAPTPVVIIVRPMLVDPDPPTDLERLLLGPLADVDNP